MKIAEEICLGKTSEEMCATVLKVVRKDVSTNIRLSNMKSKVLVISLVIIIILSGVFLTRYVNKMVKEAGMKPCILSLEKPIIDSLRDSKRESNIILSSEWKTLTPEESKILLRPLVTAGKTDCGSMNGIQEGNDYWRGRLRIAIRQSPTIYVKIFSDGPDGEENTEDDLGFESGSSKCEPAGRLHRCNRNSQWIRPQQSVEQQSHVSRFVSITYNLPDEKPSLPIH